MLEPLKIGEKVLVFYHPFMSNSASLDLNPYEGVVVARESLVNGGYWYKVKTQSSEFTGLHGKVSSDDYYFLRTSEYKEYLVNILKDLDKQKIEVEKILIKL